MIVQRVPRAVLAAVGAAVQALIPAKVPAAILEDPSAATPPAVGDSPAGVPSPLALAGLPDSELFSRAAYVIENWYPLVITSPWAIERTTDSVGELVGCLRDRAAQFAAVEADADRPFLHAVETGHDIGLTHAAETFTQWKGRS